jgi:hypothetical protein
VQRIEVFDPIELIAGQEALAHRRHAEINEGSRDRVSAKTAEPGALLRGCLARMLSVYCCVGNSILLSLNSTN